MSPGCPSSFGSAVSPASLRSQDLRLNSLFPQRVTSFTLDHVKKLKNHPIVGNTGHLDNEIDLPGSPPSSPRDVQLLLLLVTA